MILTYAPWYGFHWIDKTVTIFIYIPLMIAIRTWSSFLFSLSMLSQWDHYTDVIMSAMASQNTNLTIVYSTVYSRRRLEKTTKFSVTRHWPLCVCVCDSPVAGEFPTQRASNVGKVSIWWRHRAITQGLARNHCMDLSCLLDFARCRWLHDYPFGIPYLLSLPLTIFF